VQAKAAISSNRRVAKRVRQMRRAKRWSQEVFAERCGLHRTYIGMIERGEGNITLDTLDLLAAALQVPSSALLHERK